jgi:hypothetical protein
MRNTFRLTALIGLFSVSAIAWPTAQQPVSATSPATTVTTMDDVLQAIRADLQGDRTDILAKNVTMSSEWPRSSGRCTRSTSRSRT